MPDYSLRTTGSNLLHFLRADVVHPVFYAGLVLFFWLFKTRHTKAPFLTANRKAD